ncbi:membrane protein [Weizmannia acidilactici]|uniref:Membrane protein n=1 Tax=Weizmannia acidilactici TaxID=2607726 RepID=A0A5J4JAJ9_9BACI|nr:TerC family protein [Weizmannia acidilactici]GER68149.1 membrane protein [Weizmannia acidilactici]GER71812.1 membrane protein [Weizmannia acidilactici]GER74514.1 membrane protein [Weizmannia acidilactici]
MDMSMLLEYGWVLLVLVGLEGILAADNAVVMAVMVKHLPQKQQKKSLFYGLLGAFIFRFTALFLISFLAGIWQIQAVGAAYLFFIMIHYYMKKRQKTEPKATAAKSKPASFWMTVLKVELADIAFAIDSMLAAVALAVTLRPAGWFTIGGIDGGQFIVMFLGGAIGLVLIRFAANQFVRLLKKYPGLEDAAFLIVGWVGVKLLVFTLSHPGVGLLDEHFPESAAWKLVFWTVMLAIVAGGYFISIRKDAGVAKKSERNLPRVNSKAGEKKHLNK